LTAFSLLLCVYAKENPQFLSQSLASILSQTVLPDELLIVKDGPLTDELETVLSGFAFPNEYTVIALPENVTLGPARAQGVKAARHDWVAVMDSDDICLPDRFEKQLKLIERNPALALIGGQIAEFGEDPWTILAKRTVPITNREILRYAKKRNPINHVTAMFRRELALEAGNYRYFPLFEDYDLWARMLKNGAQCENHPDVLVNVRVGRGMYGRRRGMDYARSEWRMQKQLKELGLINGVEFLRNVAVRIPVRLLPVKWLAAIYRGFARGKP
jgi:glycosyltransferase involved in cell wall biosynthesis